MRAYTIARLAKDAGFTVHTVRTYAQRGLVPPSYCTASGYRIYDGRALDRLRMIRAGREAGMSLSLMEEICQAVDQRDERRLARCVAAVRSRIDDIRAALAAFDAALKILGAHAEAQNGAGARQRYRRTAKAA